MTKEKTNSGPERHEDRQEAGEELYMEMRPGGSQVRVSMNILREV